MAESLSDQQNAELWETFKLFDKDGDGTITTMELGKVMRSLGLAPSENELNAIIKEVDEDGNGAIEFDEFKQMMARRMREAEPEEQLREAFQIFDPDRRGYISAQHLSTILTTLGEKMTDEEVKEFLQEADMQGDGKVNYIDFTHVLTDGIPGAKK